MQGLSAWRNGTILNWRSQRVVSIFTPDACLALLEQQRCTCMPAQRRLSMIF